MLVMIPLLLASLLPSLDGYAVSDPKIDLFKLESNDGNNNRWCQSTICPRFSIIESDNVPKPIEARLYDATYWLSTPWFPAMNGSCLGGDDMLNYYGSLVQYFQGLNTMGLKIERTRPIRVVSRFDAFDPEQLICSVRFYIPDLQPMHPPAPIVTDVFVGWDDVRSCYVVPKSGSLNWKTVTRINTAMLKYLKRLNRRNLDEDEVMVDVFTGYGVADTRKVLENVVCTMENRTY